MPKSIAWVICWTQGAHACQNQQKETNELHRNKLGAWVGPKATENLYLLYICSDVFEIL